MPLNAGKMNQRVSRFSNFLGEAPDPPHRRAPPVPLSDGLDTRPCQILDPPLKTFQQWKKNISATGIHQCWLIFVGHCNEM